MKIGKDNKYSPIEFKSDVLVTDNYYVDANDNQWLVSSLIQHVKEQELVPFKLPLQCIDIGVNVWNTKNVYKVAYHAKRALNVTLEHPVIMDESGFIMDGWHRILRALIEDKEYVMAVRFTKTPPPDISGDNGK